MRILVADDERSSRVIARLAVQTLGHECETATDGAEAWKAFQSRPHDVVISDWLMPGLSGLQLCRNIRAHPASGYPYFIMVTGQGARNQVVEGMTAGADDYLVKPLDTDILQARLIGATRVTSLHRELDERRAELETLNRSLTEVSLRDALTGLGNRMALEEDLDQLQARVTRYGHRYCVALLDVDHFKAYNDTYGHQAGDQALRMVAAQIEQQARGGDAVYRYGGEEFLCIFPEQTLETATIAAERMRSSLEKLAVPHGDNAHGVLTMSGGLAILDSSGGKSVGEVLKEADEALYRAKDLGRNRIERGSCVGSEHSTFAHM